MVPLDELPYPVLGCIIRFLSIADLVSVSEVWQSWKEVALRSLRTVRIDESTVYGGSWQKYYREKNKATRVSNFEKFARDLANCTDEIEHLYFDGSDIPPAVFEILLSSQKKLKTLVVNLEKKGSFYDRNTEIGKAITRGIIKHENSLEKINVGVTDVFLSFKAMADAFRYKDSCFPNLKSIEFLSTAAGVLDWSEGDYDDDINNESDGYDDDYDDYDDYLADGFDYDHIMGSDNNSDDMDDDGDYHDDDNYYYCDDDDADNYVHSIIEFESAELLFKKMFERSKIEELNYKPKKPILSLSGVEDVFWCSSYIRLLRNYFQSGAFSNLKKINIDSINTRGINGAFSQADADLRIQNCPCISHIDSDLFFAQNIDDYRIPAAVHDEKPFLKIIRHYGSQLVHLHCYTNTNIAKCIVENCPNIKTLTITDFFGNGISNSALIALSGLQKLKKITIFFCKSGKDGFIVFLENCVNRLVKLQIFFEVTYAETASEMEPNHEAMFHIIQENGKKLETFTFHTQVYSIREYKVVMNACTEMLSGCLSLKCLILEIAHFADEDLAGKIWRNYIKKLGRALISHHKDLHYLGLYPLSVIPKEIKQTLIKRMPYCEMEFDNCFNNYNKF